MTLGVPPIGLPVTNTWVDTLTSLHNTLEGSGQSTCSSSLTVTTTETDVPGCSAGVTVAGGHALLLVIGTFDVQAATSTPANIVLGKCNLDGLTAPQNAIWEDNGANGRCTVTQTWIFPLTSGSHTVKLRASKIAAGGTHMANVTHTTMSFIIFDLL